MNVNKNAKHIVDRLQKAGFDTFLVGGCVRDMIMEREPKDWDIVTKAKPEDIKRICSDMKPLGIGEAFGIITLTFNDEQFEVATFRTDFAGTDGRHPDKIGTAKTIVEDLARRDFRMNAIAFDPIKGTVIDPFAGGLDIADGFISFVGEAKDRIEEDRLRILRGFRFVAQFGFELDGDAVDAITECEDPFKGVSQERITAEFCKILTALHGVETIAMMMQMGILTKIIPELEELMVEHESPWHNETWPGFGNTIFAHVLHVMDNAPRTVEAQMAALLHDVGKGRCKVVKEVA